MVRPCALPYLLPAVVLASCAHPPATTPPLQFAYQQSSGAPAGQGATIATDASPAFTGQNLTDHHPIFTQGKVLLVRTQPAPEPTPQPTAAELKILVQEQAQAAAEQVAHQVSMRVAQQSAEQTTRSIRQAEAIAQQARFEAQAQAEAIAQQAKLEAQAQAQAIAEQAKLEAQAQAEAIAQQAKLEAQAIAQQTKLEAQNQVQQTTTQLAEKYAQKYENLATRTDNLLNQTSAVLAANTSTQQAVTAQLNASTQLGESVKQTTSAQLAQLESTTQQKIAQLEQSSLKPADVQTIAATVATQTAAATANKTATEIATQVAAQTALETATQTATQTAEATVASAVPQFRALALQSVKDSESYIRTIARNTVQDDSDPAIQQAMANAARNVIVKDDKVVFAIRKAVTDGLVEAGLTSPTTRLGDVSPAAGYPSIITADAANAEGRIDTTRLGIAPLLSTPAGIAQKGDNPNLATLSPAAGRAPSLTPSRNRTGLINLRQYRVIVHEDNRTLEQLLAGVLQKAEPYTGPWQIKWKISEENKDLLTEKFSLDVETTFEEFANYLAQYMVNERGIKLSFNLFDSERIIVVSD